MSGGPHPERCRRCRGTGWQPGPTTLETVYGRTHRYTTVAPCEHDWWNDDPGYNPHTDEPLATDHPRAAAAVQAGIAQGRADLYEMSGGQLGAPLPAKTPTPIAATSEEF